MVIPSDTPAVASLRGLTEKQQRFVWAMATKPGISQQRAAEIAGYDGGPNTWKVKACVMMQDERIVRAIRDVASKRLQGSALGAAEFLTSLWSNPEVAMSLRVRAAESVLDRVGLGGEQNINVKHEHTDMTGAAMVERIRALAVKHGLDPQQFLGVAQKPQMKVIEHDDVGRGGSEGGRGGSQGGQAQGAGDGAAEPDVEVGPPGGSGGGGEVG